MTPAETSPPVAPVKVISIVGPGRSGSTLLARILGELPGVLNLGELRWLWERGILQARPCSCGVAPVDCPQWSRVLTSVFAEVPRGSGQSAAHRQVGAIVAAQRRLSKRRRRLWAIRSRRAPGARVPGLQEVRTATEDVVHALTATTGARVLVDASKRPLDAAVLASLGSVQQHVVHLVRDPRAVAFSWGRGKRLPTPGRGPDLMARRGAVRSAGRWLENNAGCELLRREVPADRWGQVRYEDFISDPTRVLSNLCDRLGEPDVLPLEGDRAVRLGTGHSVAGNPSRFEAGEVAMRPDMEWQSAMSRRDKVLVTCLTLPLLRRYAYPLVVRG